jgi:hypothetical protein
MIALPAQRPSFAETQPLLFGRLIVSWDCTRRVPGSKGAPVLQRARLTVIVEPFDDMHVAVEACVEVNGARVKTVKPPASHACSMAAAAGLIHLDIAGAHGERLLALTFTQDRARLVFAQTSMLARADMADGSCDRPVLETSGVRVAQSV